MKISFKWLSEYVTTSLTAHEVADALTSVGLEVDSVEEVQAVRGGLEGLDHPVLVVVAGDEAADGVSRRCGHRAVRVEKGRQCRAVDGPFGGHRVFPDPAGVRHLLGEDDDLECHCLNYLYMKRSMLPFGVLAKGAYCSS